MSTVSSINSVNNSYNTAENNIYLSNLKSRNLETELNSEQQRLNKLSGNATLTEAEKIKEKLKIQQKIAELNRKLKMEEMKEEQLQKDEVEKEKEKEKEEIKEEPIEYKEFSPEEIYEMLNGTSVVKREYLLENTKERTDRRKNILEAEIRMDSFYGSENQYKEKQLSEIRTDEFIQSEVKKAVEDKKQRIFSARDMHVVKVTKRENKES